MNRRARKMSATVSSILGAAACACPRPQRGVCAGTALGQSRRSKLARSHGFNEIRASVAFDAQDNVWVTDGGQETQRQSRDRTGSTNTPRILADPPCSCPNTYEVVRTSSSSALQRRGRPGDRRSLRRAVERPQRRHLRRTTAGLHRQPVERTATHSGRDQRATVLQLHARHPRRDRQLEHLLARAGSTSR